MRVLIADDHGIVRSGLRKLLESEDGIEVVAEASNGAEARTGGSGVEATAVVGDAQLQGVAAALDSHPYVLGAGVLDRVR